MNQRKNLVKQSREPGKIVSYQFVLIFPSIFFVLTTQARRTQRFREEILIPLSFEPLMNLNVLNILMVNCTVLFTIKVLRSLRDIKEDETILLFFPQCSS